MKPSIVVALALLSRALFAEAQGAAPVDREVGLGLPPNSTNRTENGSLAAGSLGQLRAWSVYSFANPPGTGAGSAVWVADDATGDPNSGSVLITNSSTTSVFSSFGVRQCIRPGRPVAAEDCASGVAPQVTVRVPPGQSPVSDDGVVAFVYKFASDDCTGPHMGGGGLPLDITAAGTNGWVTMNPSWASRICVWDPQTRSVEVRFVLSKGFNSAPLQVYFDDLGVRGYFQHVKGDVNRDGETDLILHNTVTGENAVWFMKDERRMSAPVTISPTPASLDWQIAGVADFDADDDNDLLLWDSVTGAAEFWLMDGTTRVGAAVPLAGALPPPWRPSATADFDNDGKPDLVYRNLDTQKISVWTLNGSSPSGTLTPSPDQAVHVNWEVVAAQDLNADGHTDLLWYNRLSGKVVYWWLDGSLVRIAGGFTNPANAGDNNWKVVAGGDYGIGPDLSGPGLPNTQDIVWRNTTSGRIVLWHMDNAGNRSAGLFVTPDPPAPATEWVVAGPR